MNVPNKSCGIQPLKNLIDTVCVIIYKEIPQTRKMKQGHLSVGRYDGSE